MSSMQDWEIVNQQLVARAIGELTFEQIFSPREIGHGEYELTLSSGISYQFSGEMSVWQYLRVCPESIVRSPNTKIAAGQFFIDSQNETGMDDIILANFLEEMHNTLYADLEQLKLSRQHSLLEIADWDGEKLQTVLQGHPKILLNKGRINWDTKALADYAPESNHPFKLHWLAVRTDLLDQNTGFSEIPSELTARLNDKTTHSYDYTIIPVHPWQWTRFLAIQFCQDVCNGNIIYLGEAGDDYLPQTSIRTLSNLTHPKKPDIKLPLTILNTSCYRGLPANTLLLGQEISEILHTLCQEDAILNKYRTQVLREKTAGAFLHPLYQQLTSAPYRYHELLGYLYRESTQSKLADGEMAVLTAALFHQDAEKNSLIQIYIERSGLTAHQWLRRYFEVTVIPLYHLQLKYGVGLVAHGQNIVLRMKNYIPQGIILKDFQGDMRLSSELPADGQAHFAHLTEKLTRLPPHYLIHDLITGHFITVLRFVSAVMKESDHFSENVFYQILGDVVESYQKTTPLPLAHADQDLLAKSFPRVLLNKVRFKIGYADNTNRPLPMVGDALPNPLIGL